MPPPPSFQARLTRARVLSPSVRELSFERLDGLPMAFEPGQWVNVVVPVRSHDADESKRSYSFASPPDGSPTFDIAVTRVPGGPASTWLHAVAPGAVLPFSGPQGFFTRQVVGGPPSLMVATGTGVTPMRAMIRAAIAAGSTARLVLLLGVRHEEDALYADELNELARAHPFFRVETTLSQPRPAWQGRRGYVQTHVPGLWQELVAASDISPHLYVCGLRRMVSSVRDLVRADLGLPREVVHTERYD
jgi:CDP-4-dehydro-6-deoxyglucose reductase, E3